MGISWNNRTAESATRKFLLAIIMVLALTVSQGPDRALAHTRTEVGPYVIVIGWENEPVIVGERNALVLQIHEGEAPVEGLEGLIDVTVFYGGHSFIGQLAPTDAPGVYKAEIFPTLRGQYEVQLVGMIGDTELNVILEPEEVLPGSVLQFPESQPDPGALKSEIENLEEQVAAARTMSYAGVAVGALGLIAGGIALVRGMKKQ